jgi:hypothetical protein
MDAFWNRFPFRGIALALTAACIAGCGAETVRYQIGGTVTGLSGAGLVLANNNSGNLAVSASGPFTFTPGLPSGATYDITVKVHPNGQSCAVTRGTGTVGTAAVTDVTVACVAAAPLTLLSANPANASINVPRANAPSLMFSAPLATPENSASITLQSAAGSHPLSTSVSGSTLTLTPRRKLLPLTGYTLTVGTALRGTSGEQLPAAVTTTFTTAEAAWQPAGLLAPETPDQSFYPTVAMNAKGDAIAVWRQYNGGTSMPIMSRLYHVNTGWGPVMEGPSSVLPPGALVLDAMGNAIAAWDVIESRSCGEDQTCEKARLYTSRFTAEDGWSEPRWVATSSDSGSTDPHIAMNSAGDAVLVWVENDGGGADVWARRYVAGDGWRSPVKIETQSASASAIQVVMNEGGDAMAVWSQGDGMGRDIWANRYTAGSWGTAVRIESNAGYGTNPRIDMNERGEAVAVWSHVDGQVFSAWFNSFSTTQGWATATLAVDGTQYAINPTITIDAAGNSLLLWEELYIEGPTSRMSVWSKPRAATSGWGAAILLMNTVQADPAQLVMDESGNAIAAWSQRDGGRSSIWSARYIANIGWGVPALLETDDAGDATLTELEMNLSGDVTAVWHQFDGPPGGGGRQHAFYRKFE